MKKLAAVFLIFVLSLAGCGGDGGNGVDLERDVWAGFEGEVEETPEEMFVNTGFYPESARDDQIKALERSNWYRWQSGLPQLDMIEAINYAAQAHSDYYAEYVSNYSSSGLSPHNEDPSWANGFTGAQFWERCSHFAYHDCSSEVIAFYHNAKLAVDGWMNTLYHRIPFMDASQVSMGYGAAGAGGWQNSNKIDTVDFGSKNANGMGYNGPEVAGIYPPPGSTGIPPSFDGMESPQPPPPPSGYPSGTIITITWSKNAVFAVEDYRLWSEEDQEDLPLVWLDHTNDTHLAGASTIAMYAYDPLQKGTKYWVYIKGKKGGLDWEKTWHFYTTRY